MKFILSLLALVASLTAQAATFYVAPSGSAGNSGTSLGSPWDLQRALTNSTYAAGDIVNLRGGTHSPPGTNAFWWKPYPGVSGAGTVTFQPYRGERVVIDARKFYLVDYDQCTFAGLEFTDSSQTNRGQSMKIFFDTQGSATGKGQVLQNCVAHDLSNLANHSMFTVVGCDFLYIGNDNYEHTVYNPNVDTNFVPRYANNVMQSSGGAAIKLIDGSYNVQAQSNVVINAAHSSMPYYSYAFWHNPPPGGGLTFDTNAPGPTVTDNFFVNDPSVSFTNVTLQNILVALGVGVTNCGPVRFSGNYLNHGNWELFNIGRSDNVDSVMQAFVGTNNTFVSATLNGAYPIVVFRKEQTNNTFTWDYNAYYTPSNSSSSANLFRKPSGSANFTGWKAAGLDTHSSLTVSSYGPDQLKVFADYNVAGRGHIIVVNHSMATNATVSLSGLGLSDGENYQLAYSQAIHDPVGWKTNFYVAGSSLQLSLRTNDWPAVAPNDTTTMTLKPALPRYGAWLVRPAPKRPVGFDGHRSATNLTQVNMSWGAPSGSDYGGYLLVKRAVGTGGTYTNSPVALDLVTSYSDYTGITNGNSYTQCRLGIRK
jgi:hypothetical protein